MSKVLVTESYLTDIGNAIRSKNNSTDKYKPSEMADAINNIVGSSGDDIEYLDRIELKNQYIDTGITPEPAYLYSYSFDASTSKDYIALFGCRKSDGNSKSFGILQTPTDGSIRLDFDDPDSNGTTTTVNAGSTFSHSIYRFYGNGTSLYASGLSGSATYTKKSISASTTSGLTASIYLGAYHRQDNNSAIFTNPDLKIYGFKITNSDTIIGNFIPASCNGVKGMYETVKNQFHGLDGTITPVNVTSVSTTGDIMVVSSDSWKTNITQSDHQTITFGAVSSVVINSNHTYSSALKFLFSISADTGYIPGTMHKSADNVRRIYNVSASPAEEIAGMIEDGWAKVYEDGENFYSDENYTTKLSSLSGDIVIAGMENPDISSYSFSSSSLCNNKNLTKFKNTFITSAGDGFLEDCTSLTSVDLSNLTSAGNYFLNNCTSLTSVNLPNLTSEGGAFLEDCTSLTSVNLPNLTSAGAGFLNNCTSLTSISLPNLTSAEAGFLQGCTSLTSISLPNLTSAEAGFLQGCTSLTSVSLPNLTSAEAGFLQGCTSLTSIDLPNLTSAAGYLFLEGCNKLQSIYLRSTTMCTVKTSSFYTKLPNTVSIYVPASLIDSYKTADYWKDYADNFKALESI